MLGEYVNAHIKKRPWRRDLNPSCYATDRRMSPSAAPLAAARLYYPVEMPAKKCRFFITVYLSVFSHFSTSTLFFIPQNRHTYIFMCRTFACDAVTRLVQKSENRCILFLFVHSGPRSSVMYHAYTHESSHNFNIPNKAINGWSKNYNIVAVCFCEIFQKQWCP